ncbi:MAG: cytochrome b/b6 domain-containing protein [Chloroflexota bacterium]
MEAPVVIRYSASARWFHWLIVAVFLQLVLSGLLIFLQWFGFPVVGTWVRIIHRVGALALVGIPGLFVLFAWRRAWYFVKEGLMWGGADLGWLKAAPGYYFGGDPRMMPPQGYINTGMKLYRVAILAGGGLFVLTGFVMWFLKGLVSPEIFRWSVVLHDFTFIVAICMFFLHVQLGVFHPRMDESLLSIVDGMVSGMYAKHHHGIWYGRIVSEQEEQQGNVNSSS